MGTTKTNLCTLKNTKLHKHQKSQHSMNFPQILFLLNKSQILLNKLSSSLSLEEEHGKLIVKQSLTFV
jgi:hypothetical protein